VAEFQTWVFRNPNGQLQVVEVKGELRWHFGTESRRLVPNSEQGLSEQGLSTRGKGSFIVNRASAVVSEKKLKPVLWRIATGDSRFFVAEFSRMEAQPTG
jgi:hypothetical protein